MSTAAGNIARKPRLLRVLVRLVVSIAIGAAATVGIAWWCAWRSAQEVHYGMGLQVGPVGWEGPVRDPRIEADPGVHQVTHVYWESIGDMLEMRERPESERRGPFEKDMPWWAMTPTRVPDHERTHPGGNELFPVYEVGCGWPWVTMVGRVLSTGPRSLASCEVQGIVLEELDRGLRPKLLPTRPAWPGFLASTVAAASAWLLVVFTIGWIRAWRRRRAGRCVACGYDMAGVPVAAGGRVCPECGRSD